MCVKSRNISRNQVSFNSLRSSTNHHLSPPLAWDLPAQASWVAPGIWHDPTGESALPSMATNVVFIPFSPPAR